MVKCDMGKVTFDGNINQLFCETSTIVRALYAAQDGITEVGALAIAYFAIHPEMDIEEVLKRCETFISADRIISLTERK